MFSKLVLKNVKDLYHVDFSAQIYDGKHFSSLDFLKKGVVYGPIRLSTAPELNEYGLLTSKVLAEDFIVDKKIICMIRDPRDILVSSYYSFGKTHPFSKNKVLERVQLVQRDRINKMSLDEYVLSEAPNYQKYFDLCLSLIERCPNHVVLKYEDMVLDFDSFYQQLNEAMPLDVGIKEKMFLVSRPKITEDLDSHKRSGQVRGFLDKLRPETTRELDQILQKTLNEFNYYT